MQQYLRGNLLDPVSGFKGQVIFTPGTNEWNKNGHENIDDLESFLQDNSKAKFWPNDGCALESETFDNVELIMVDSQWFLEDWDEHLYINNKCDIKSREQFFAEFKDDIKDAQGKTVVVVVHHPVKSATRLGFFEKLGGFDRESYYSSAQRELRGRMETIARQFEDVLFVSGSEKNLQFLKNDGTPQIISGSTVKKPQAINVNRDLELGAAIPGYSKLIIFKDGSSLVEFYSIENGAEELIGSYEIERERLSPEEVTYHSKKDFGATYKASIYTKEETDRSGFYKFLWGDINRDLYSRKIEVPVLFLDTLPGNPVAFKEGGGTHSRSLRLKDDKGHEYTVREMRKSAVQFIQASVKEHYVLEMMENTIAEDILQDFFTTAHPYAPFAVNDLLKAVDLYTPNPSLYYLPKQKNLNIFNEDYGDNLYMLEEHVGDENKEFKTFGSPDDIISTSDMFHEIQESKQVQIDEGMYIRARLMDMLIGDRDRHPDQWRWAEFEKEDGTKLYRPIPRDRDQAFPKYEGLLINLLKLGVPLLRAMETYDSEVQNIKYLNWSGYPLDKAFINTAELDDWLEQARYIQQNLTDEHIDEAFASLPEDAQDESIARIKEDLKTRRSNVEQIATEYFNYFKKFETIIGTEDEDEFLIERKNDGITQIRIKNKNDDVVFENSYNKELTDEIWIYGLDDTDSFKIQGSGDRLIRLNILGGENNDIYDFENKKGESLRL